MNIDIPEGKDPIGYVWGEMVPGIGVAASQLSLAVYSHTTLGLREFEAARLRIAQINGCVFCLDWRTERDGVKVEEEFADAVTEWRTTDAFDERTRLAAEYAERYALDHHGIDDEFWKRMAEHYSQKEIVELSMSIGSSVLAVAPWLPEESTDAEPEPVRQLAGRQVMIVHGTNDERCDPELSFRLAERAKKSNRDICRFEVHSDRLAQPPQQE
ncbi:carboxymuconolactone decarboxylase family protein, partial [Amycolatopsis lurida]|uniref:carboxymuconolactone decarboxylase family protein n=1 Tax=Amycolatopsis lurida TaxID=31959 RepID=UPI00365D1989